VHHTCQGGKSSKTTFETSSKENLVGLESAPVKVNAEAKYRAGLGCEIEKMQIPHMVCSNSDHCERFSH
jgi:hypothetical protein